jgi:hypothetical protein
MRGSSRIPEHSRIVKVLRNGNKKDTKTKKSNKKKQTPKHSVFAYYMKENDPRSIKLAKQFDVEQRLEFIKSLKKKYRHHHC